VSVLLLFLVGISLSFEALIHWLQQHWEKRRRRAMLAFLSHVRDELLLVGIISLFLSTFQVIATCRHVITCRTPAKSIPTPLHALYARPKQLMQGPPCASMHVLYPSLHTITLSKVFRHGDFLHCPWDASRYHWHNGMRQDYVGGIVLYTVPPCCFRSPCLTSATRRYQAGGYAESCWGKKTAASLLWAGAASV
jgi:hypothetical protein